MLFCKAYVISCLLRHFNYNIFAEYSFFLEHTRVTMYDMYMSLD